MRLQAGQRAPLFSSIDIRTGEPVELRASSTDTVWLGFFRFATCPLCNLRVHEMIAAWPRFAGKCRYIAVFQSPKERFGPFITQHSPPFPVIADPEMALFKLYGVENSLLAALAPAVLTRTVEAKRAGFAVGALSPKDGAALRVPADFVIAPGGTIALAFYGRDVSESVPFADVQRLLTV